MSFAAAHESGFGPEPKYELAVGMSAFGGRPDQGLHGLRQPLLTQPRHAARAGECPRHVNRTYAFKSAVTTRAWAVTLPDIDQAIPLDLSLFDFLLDA